MPDKVEMYDGEYGNYDVDVYRQVRMETYGVDFGQTSWVTTEESTRISTLLELNSTSSVLEIGCGSGVRLAHCKSNRFQCHRPGHQHPGHSQREPIGIGQRDGGEGSI